MSDDPVILDLLRRARERLNADPKYLRQALADLEAEQTGTQAGYAITEGECLFWLTDKGDTEGKK